MASLAERQRKAMEQEKNFLAWSEQKDTQARAERAARLAQEREEREEKFRKSKMGMEAYAEWRLRKRKEMEEQRKEERLKRVIAEEENAQKSSRQAEAKEAYERWRREKEWKDLLNGRQPEHRHVRATTSPARLPSSLDGYCSVWASDLLFARKIQNVCPRPPSSSSSRSELPRRHRTYT